MLSYFNVNVSMCARSQFFLWTTVYVQHFFYECLTAVIKENENVYILLLKKVFVCIYIDVYVCVCV